MAQLIAFDKQTEADPELDLARVAGAIAEPTRSAMLCSLLDGSARTSTELAALAGIGAPTASMHLLKMKEAGLVQAFAQGRNRYYRLSGPHVARALEALMIVANGEVRRPKTTCPPHLRLARSCYDHLAGEVAVALHDHLLERNWIVHAPAEGEYSLSAEGERELTRLGVDVEPTSRRRFAYACVDWSVRRPHVAGALGAALLQMTIERGWLRRQLDSRVLTLTMRGRRELHAKFGLQFPDARIVD
jgi:DNA-binding transcriptional ArsR family regulator